MAELADAHGSGPCECKFMQVQVLLPAPKRGRFYTALNFLYARKFTVCAIFEILKISVYAHILLLYVRRCIITTA